MSTSDTGASLVDTVMVLALVTTVLATGAPLIGQARDAMSERHACQWMAGHFRSTRQHALLTGRPTAILFDHHPTTGWTMRTCGDGNGDGVSRSDVDRGVDLCQHPSLPLNAWVPDAAIGRRPEVPDVSGGAGAVVSFGSARQLTFSPEGTSSSGTVTVMTSGGRHCAVRVAGITGRVRVLTFTPLTGRWVSLP